MRYPYTTALFISTVALAHAYVAIPGKQQQQRCLYSPSTSSSPKPISTSTPSSPLFMSDFGSDFASAMPEKPTLTIQEQMLQSATEFIANIESRLKEGVSPPPELEELRKARDDNAEADVLASKIYALLIEQGMLYDRDPENGMLSPTEFNIKENLDVPEVKQEFAYLYKYGMNMVNVGVLDVESVKGIVKKRLIDRTGLTPEEFDAWLGY